MAAAPPTSDAFVDLVRKSGLVEQDRFDAYLTQQRALAALPCEPRELATVLIRAGFLTYFQAMQLLKGKYRGFTLNKYRILERLGSGSNSSVFLCQHLTMGRKVAVKILPISKAEDPTSLARFYREARAAGSLDHPNIVHTYDNGQEGDIHFLVMEYVDGTNLQAIVQKYGPMDIARAAAYIRQAAVGLQHLHQAGLIHRDIKPGNLLLERRGVIKILDLGLARFFHDHQDMLTQQANHATILGTADYLSPEQTLDSHDVDARTDIYGLGATFYYLLAGRPPFEAKAVSQKLLAHLMKEPTPLPKLRPEVPEGLAAVIQKMMAKDRDQRFQSAAAVVVALAPWTQTSILPPPAHEMPQLCPAAHNAGSGEASFVPAAAAETARSVFRERGEERTLILHGPAERQGGEQEASTARVERAQAIGRAAAKSRKSGRNGPPAGGQEPPPPAPAADPKPDKKRRPSKRRDAEDTINSLRGIDTRPDLHESMQPASVPTQPAPVRRGRTRWVRLVKAVCVMAAILGGIALHAFLSRPRMSEASQRPLPEAASPANREMDRDDPSDAERVPELGSEARNKSLPTEQQGESPFAVYTKESP